MKSITVTAAVLGGTLVLGALTGAPAHAAATCDGRAATIEVPATTGYETAPVVGTPGDDIIVGTDQRDTIDGAGGNDVICGLAGDDSLTGGPGDDRIFGGLDADYYPDDDYWGDVIAPGPGDDHVGLGADPDSLRIAWVDFGYYDRVDYSDAPGPVTVDLTAGAATGEGTDTIVAGASAGVLGSAYGDAITGSAYNDWLVGAGGDDVITGLEGKDVLDPDGTNRRPDPDIPATSADDDVADGGPGNDMIVSYGGHDRLAGGPDNDYIVALPATTGSVHGGPGRDRFRIEGAVDVSAGSGRDQVDYDLQPGFRGEIDGDGGRDKLTIKLSRAFGKGEKVRVDRPRDLMTVSGSTTRLGYVEIEQLHGSGGQAHWTFVGTRAAERVWIQGGRSLRAFAKGGDDDLLGTGGRDLLHGGPGRDRADGSSARDTCVAVERARRCEVRR